MRDSSDCANGDIKSVGASIGLNDPRLQGENAPCPLTVRAREEIGLPSGGLRKAYLKYGLRVDQAKRLKDLEVENARLKRLLDDAELDKAILREAASGNFCARRSAAERSSMFASRSACTGCCSVGPAAY